MLAALQSQFDAIKEDASVRAVILSGQARLLCRSQPKGNDRGRQAEDGGKAYFKDLFDRCATMMMSIQKLPQPVIAQVHGIATAQDANWWPHAIWPSRPRGRNSA